MKNPIEASTTMSPFLFDTRTKEEWTLAAERFEKFAKHARSVTSRQKFSELAGDARKAVETLEGKEIPQTID